MPYNTKEKQQEYSKRRMANRTEEQKQKDRERVRLYQRNKNLDPAVREANRVNAQAYRDRDPLRARVSVHQHGVRRRNEEAAKASPFTDMELYEWLKLRYGQPCTYCGEKSSHIDHKIPLTRGGAHCFSNLDMICEDCNRAKRDRTPEEFLAHVMKISARHST